MDATDTPLTGPAVADLLAEQDPPLDLAALADEVAGRGDRTLASFTSEELAATTPLRPALPGLPEDAWLAQLDPDAREVALAAATRSLAARRLVTPAAGQLRLHGDLRLVHELRARATTVVQVEVRRRDATGAHAARHLACRPCPGLVLHLAAAGGVHHAALRSEPAVGLLLASVLVDAPRAVASPAPEQLPPAAVGRDHDRLRRAAHDAPASLVAVASHRHGDDLRRMARVGLFATPTDDVVLWRPGPDESVADPLPSPQAHLHLVPPAVAVAICAGLLLPEHTPEIA